MSEDDVRDELALAISFADEELGAGIPAEELADALLPVVDRIAREAVAEALEAKARQVEEARDVCGDADRRRAYAYALLILRAGQTS